MKTKKKTAFLGNPTAQEWEEIRKETALMVGLFFEYETKPKWAGVTDGGGRRFDGGESVLQQMSDNSLSNLVVRAAKHLANRHKEFIKSVEIVTRSSE